MKMQRVIGFILNSIALTMGVIVVVMFFLGRFDIYNAVFLLGIGLVCLGIGAFQERIK